MSALWCWLCEGCNKPHGELVLKETPLDKHLRTPAHSQGTLAGLYSEIKSGMIANVRTE